MELKVQLLTSAGTDRTKSISISTKGEDEFGNAQFRIKPRIQGFEDHQDFPASISLVLDNVLRRYEQACQVDVLYF